MEKERRKEKVREERSHPFISDRKAAKENEKERKRKEEAASVSDNGEKEGKKKKGAVP